MAEQNRLWTVNETKASPEHQGREGHFTEESRGVNEG